ncbi:DUF2357 domain-containing protein [Anaerobacillus isosaccharinicus]|uniref:DUF2357 domain-containing protein n=1 Tax=Anaerobacillus isosaccharinicus TaxID=1532552 RepID=A0A1S2M2G4_9BACI|nr:DUF2357 domain-containing protein [Anaerobacillus isosaccharinicus]MBA5584835.1 DUF2357 domain-containing protein [Anaerobacillus isosaccharinicus]QOY36802.1 DUF2357 domain-containing protein [Anaerobacillus isosaccharinicus]
MAIHCKNQVLPLHLYFEDVRGKVYDITKIWNKQSEIKYDELPILMENARIGLRFYLESEDIDIQNASLRIQTSRYRDVEEKEIFTIPLSSKEELHWLYQGEKKDEEFPWRMGVYFIELHLNGNVYVGGFNVVPLHLNVSQVEKMHDFLNEQVRGIIYDFVYSGESLNTNSNLDLPEYWYYDYARQLSEYYTGFMHSMTKLTKRPHEYIQTIYEPSLTQGRTDSKSIRWATSNKGQVKNRGAAQQLYTLNKKKHSHINTKPNKWLKNILLIWANDISEVSLAIQKDKERLIKRSNELKSEYEGIIARKEKLANRKDVGENTRRDIKSRLIMCEKDQVKAQNQYHILKNWLNLCKRQIMPT